MTNKILGFIVLLGLANLAVSASVACSMCDCSGDACCVEEKCVLLEQVTPVPTAKHEKYQPSMGSSTEPQPKVNAKALFEKKGQQPPAVNDADALAKQYGAQVLQSRWGGYYASLPEGYVWEATGQRGSYSAPTKESLARQMSRGVRPFRRPNQPQPKPQPQPYQQPQPNGPIGIQPGDQPLYTLNRGRVLLFVDASPESATLKGWFDVHDGLRALKDECDFVLYRESDLLYKALFSPQIGPEDFPAVIVANEVGAKIYGAAWPDIPDTADGLYKAIREGADHLAEARENSDGNLTAAGYSNPPCYEPNCPAPNNQQPPPPPQYDDSKRLPREGGLVDRLRNKAEEKGAGMIQQAMWGWLHEILWAGVGVLVVIVAFVLGWKALDQQHANQ